MLVSKMQAFLFCSIFSEQLTCTRTQVRHQEYGSKKMRSDSDFTVSVFHKLIFIIYGLPLQICIEIHNRNTCFSPNFNLPHKHTSKRERKVVCVAQVSINISGTSKCSYLIKPSAIVTSLIRCSCHKLYSLYKSSERENPTLYLMTTSN